MPFLGLTTYTALTLMHCLVFYSEPYILLILTFIPLIGNKYIYIYCAEQIDYPKRYLRVGANNTAKDVHILQN